MKITFAIGSRANLGSCRAVIERLAQEHAVNAICYSTALSARYGSVVEQVEQLCDVVRVHTYVDGGTPEATVAESGMVLDRVGDALSRMRPDLVYVVGDRFEVVPVAYAAHLLGLKLAQQMAGEVSGTIDDKNRHAITQLGDYFFCATERSVQRVQSMFEGPVRAFHTGCPRIDIAARVKPVQRERPYIVVSMHPDVTTWTESGAQMRAVLDGVDAAWDGDVELFWPANEAGCEAIVQAVRDRKRPYITHRSLEDSAYYALLAGARCAVGNSSSFIREGSFLGVPVVLVGDRQRGREMVDSVMLPEPGEYAASNIACAIRIRTKSGHTNLNIPVVPSTLYGSGDAAEKIAEVLRG